MESSEALLQTTIGKNLKAARLQAEISMQDVMQTIWGISDRKNRLSEVENGSRMPSPFVLLRMAMLYDVSLDSIFGFTEQLRKTKMVSDSRGITRDLKKTATNIMDGISSTLVDKFALLPRVEAIIVLNEAQRLVSEYQKHIQDFDFKIACQSLDGNIAKISEAASKLEVIIAKSKRASELTMYEVIQDSYQNESNEDIVFMDEETRNTKEYELQKTIGKNLKKARQYYAQKSLQAVMIEIWNIADSKNRLKAIESGSRMPTPYILMRLAHSYGVSMDFIFGLSHEIECDEVCALSGRTVQGLRELANDIVEKIGLTLSKQVKVLPRNEAVVLLEESKEFIFKYKNNVLNKNYIEINNKLGNCFESFEQACNDMDIAIARHFRVMEMSIFDHINKIDNQIETFYLTDSVLRSE